MKKGLDSIATISATAPWVGLFGTLLGIANSFPGFDTDKASAMAVIFERLSNGLVPAAFGLVVALIAICFYKYLLSEVETLDLEIESASLQLINDLRAFGPRTSN